MNWSIYRVNIHMCVCMCNCNLEHEHIEYALKIANSIWACEHAGLTWWLSGKESTCSAGDADLIPGLEDSPGEGNGNPLQYSCLGNPMGRSSWQATVHEVTKQSDTTEQLNNMNILQLASPYEPVPLASMRKAWSARATSISAAAALPLPNTSISRCQHRLQWPQSQPWNLQAFCNCERKLYFIALASAVTFKWNSFAFHFFLLPKFIAVFI